MVQERCCSNRIGRGTAELGAKNLAQTYEVRGINKHNYKHKKHLRINKKESLVRDNCLDN